MFMSLKILRTDKRAFTPLKKSSLTGFTLVEIIIAEFFCLEKRGCAYQNVSEWACMSGCDESRGKMRSD